MRINSFLPAVVRQSGSYAKPLAIVLALGALAYLLVQGAKSLLGRVQPRRNFNDLICHNEDILRYIFSILKNPNLSLVCKSWYEVNRSPETYQWILGEYNQQEFMTRFTIQLPLQAGEEYIGRVKQIFDSVQAMVKAAKIESNVKQARVQGKLGLLELNPVMRMLEEQSFIVFFRTVAKVIPQVMDLYTLYSLNERNLSLKGKSIRLMIQDNPAGLHIATNLDIRDCGLAILPPEIGLLINLTVLKLSGNQFAKLPPEIGQLPNLQLLSLSGSQLTVLPTQISQLVKLEELYLNGNQLTELPPEICQLPNLRRLELEKNQLKKLPLEIGQLIKLHTLYLNGNQLTELPPEICKLTGLGDLDLRNNQLTKLPSGLRTLCRNKQLNCLGNPVYDLPRRAWFS
jgi:hypothetical protein